MFVGKLFYSLHVCNRHLPGDSCVTGVLSRLPMYELRPDSADVVRIPAATWHRGWALPAIITVGRAVLKDIICILWCRLAKMLLLSNFLGNLN